MSIQELFQVQIDRSNIPAKRCHDYDDECAQVKDHFACMAGSIQLWNGEILIVDPIDGFCPFVCGMMKP
jgi:hypothetical protein